MSGVTSASLGWQDQLKDVQQVLASGSLYSDYDARRTGRRTPSNKRRKVPKFREPNPFDEIEEIAIETYSREIPGGKGKDAESGDSATMTVGSGYILNTIVGRDRSEEGPMVINVDTNPPSFGHDGDNPNSDKGIGTNSKDTKDRRKSEDAQAVDVQDTDLGGDVDDEDEPTEEELEEYRRQLRRNKIVRKSVLWATLSAGCTAIIACSAVIGIGLMRGHRSNIMNL